MYNKIPIDSIKYQLSLYLPEEELDNSIIDELAMSCYRQIGHENMFVSTYEKGMVRDHMYIIKNSSFYKLKQCFIKPLASTAINTDTNDIDISISTEEFPNSVLQEDLPTSLWTNMLKPVANTVSNTVDSTYSVMYMDNNLTITSETCLDIHTCVPSFKLVRKTINGVDNLIIYTNVKEGVLLMSMLEYDDQMEDDEELKQCLIKYVISHIMLRKAYMASDYKLLELAKGLEKESNTLMGKIKGKMNLPDENTLENIRLSYHNIIGTDKYKEGFRQNHLKLKHI